MGVQTYYLLIAKLVVASFINFLGAHGVAVFDQIYHCRYNNLKTHMMQRDIHEATDGFLAEKGLILFDWHLQGIDLKTNH